MKEGEQRRFRRVNCSVSVVSMMKIADQVLKGGQFGSVLNLSLGGMLFEVSRPYPEGASVKVTLQIRGRYLEVYGRVIRVNEYEPGKVAMAVEFEELPKAEYYFLERFLEDEAKKQAQGL